MKLQVGTCFHDMFTYLYSASRRHAIFSYQNNECKQGKLNTPFCCWLPSSSLVFTWTKTRKGSFRSTDLHALSNVSAFLLLSTVSTTNKFGMAWFGGVSGTSFVKKYSLTCDSFAFIALKVTNKMPLNIFW